MNGTMVTVSFEYHFRQPFRAPAPAAFDWCTDFEPEDAAIFSSTARRRVRKLAPNLVITTEVTYPNGRRRTISRLVRIYPARRAWTSTHLDGPFRHSQFWYRVVPDGRTRSHLEFTGLKVETAARPLTAAERARRAAEDRRADAAVWRNAFAPALDAACRD